MIIFINCSFDQSFFLNWLAVAMMIQCDSNQTMGWIQSVAQIDFIGLRSKYRVAIAAKKFLHFA